MINDEYLKFLNLPLIIIALIALRNLCLSVLTRSGMVKFFLCLLCRCDKISIKI